MKGRSKVAAVPAEALLKPTLMLTGRSAAVTYAQPAGELKRLAEAGAIIKIARGYYAAVPIGKQAGDWLPSMEDLTAGVASAVYGPGKGALWGLSAARVHGAVPRAIANGHAFGPAQHRPITLLARPGQIQFRRRDPERLALEYLDTELGPGLVTSVAQTILDLSSRAFAGEGDPRTEAVRNLMSVVDLGELTGLATRVRGRKALARARTLVHSGSPARAPESERQSRGIVAGVMLPVQLDTDALGTICDRYGVAELAIFGSALTGTMTAESDIDVLYVLRDGVHLGWAVNALSDDLAALLGRPVDLVAKQALHERLRESVLAEAQVLYAA